MRASWAVVISALVVASGAGGAVGYAVSAHRSNVTVLTGTFYVGDRQASGAVDGWTYGMNDSVDWLDSHNTWHEGGWPDCLEPVGSTKTIRFGYTPVDGPTSNSWRQIVWVSCVP